MRYVDEMVHRINVLNKQNNAFCHGAREMRWEDGNTWFKTIPNGSEINELGWYRSIAYRIPSRYVFVIDIDANGIDNNILSCAHLVASELENILQTKPQMKASGMKGVHIFKSIAFPGTYNDNTCLRKMMDLANTAYVNSGIEKRGINIGRTAPQPCVDMHMYEHSRLVRGYCKHTKSGLFAVPIMYNDSIDDIHKRMRLEEDIPEIDMSFVKFNPRTELLPYDKSQDFFGSKIDVSKISASEILEISKKYRNSDPYYKRLPSILKGVVNMEGDIHHTLKWPLVQYLHLVCLMTTEEILAWLAANVRWKEPGRERFDPTTKESIYQVSYTVDWTDNVYNDFDGLQNDRLPIYKRFLGEEEVDAI